MRGRLLRLVRSGKTPQRVALRARLVLMAADGASNSETARAVGVSRPTVLLWRDRFEQFGVAGLLKDAPRPGRKKRLTSELVQRIVEETQRSKPEGGDPLVLSGDGKAAPGVAYDGAADLAAVSIAAAPGTTVSDVR